MTDKLFFEAKKELLRDMEQAEMCRESIHAVQKCETLTDLVRVMNTLSVQLIGENFPRVEWLRHYFNKIELAEHGIFLDTTTIEVAPKSHLWLFGNSHVMVYGNETKLIRITAHQHSRITLHALDFSMWSVELQQESSLHIDKQDQYAKISIRDKRQ